MKNAAQNAAHAREEAIQKRFFHRHKELFTSAVMPVILGTTLFLVLTHLANTWRFYSALGVILALDVFNVYFSRRQRPVKTPFGTFDSRSDKFDTFRWCLNLPFDVYVLWALGLDFASASFMWLVLTFGALTEIFGLRNRFITVSVALGCFAVMTQIFDTSWRTSVYVLSCYMGIVFILFRFERWLYQEMESYHESEKSKASMEADARLLQRQAVIGNQARTICHEINNLLSILQMSVGRLKESKRNTEDARALSVKRMQRALATLTRISQVVLKDVGVSQDTRRFYPLDQLVTDFELLIESQFGNISDLAFQLTLPKKKQLGEYGVVEATGTTYLIAHNLVKNAVDAVSGPNAINGAKVTMDVRIEGEELCIEVKDNGAGFPLALWDDIVSGKGTSVGKADGNGLGLRFTLEQVEMNGMSLQMKTDAQKGTTFILKAPLMTEREQRSAA